MLRNKVLSFDLRVTNITKGLALLFLLWHHVFFNSSSTYKRFVSVYTFPSGVPIESIVSDAMKLCVALYVFLSGYGLYCSFNKYLQKNSGGGTKYLTFSLKYIANHLIKLLSDYWFIFIIFVPLGFVFNRSPIIIYEKNLLYFIIDFFGLNNMFFGFTGKTMNATWWFMSLIITLYIIFPILYKVVKKCEFFVLSILLFIAMIGFPNDNMSLSTYLLPFAIGLVFAKNTIFETLFKYQEKKQLNLMFGIVLLFIFTIIFRIHYFSTCAKFDGIFCIPIVMFCYFVLSRMNFIGKVFELLGKHSGSIFMFHTFIYLYYFKSFIYSFKYSILIFVVLAVICLVIAVAIEWIKKITGYNKLFKFLTKKIIKQ